MKTPYYKALLVSVAIFGSIFADTKKNGKPKVKPSKARSLVKDDEKTVLHELPHEGLGISFSQKLALLPGRLTFAFFERLVGYKLGKVDKVRRLEAKIEDKQDLVGKIEGKLGKDLGEAMIQEIKDKVKKSNNESWSEITDLKKLLNGQGSDPGVAQKVVEAEFWKNMARAPGEGWLKTDILSGYVTEFPAYKVFSEQGKLPSKGALKWLARVAMVADPIVTGGALFRAIDPIFRLAVLSKDPDLVRDKCAQMMGDEGPDLGDPQNFIKADSLDTLKAVPAIAEIALLKMAASLAVGHCIDEKGGIKFSQLGQSIKDFFKDGDISRTKKLFDGKDPDNKAFLPKQRFFKADVLAIYGYLKYCLEMVVGDKIFKLDDPKVLSAVYKKTGGMIDSGFVSFLASMATIHSLNKKPFKNMMRLKSTDADLVGMNLTDYNTAGCLLKEVDDSDIGRGEFEPRTIGQAFGRYFFEKAVSRVIFGLLKKVESPVTGFCERTLDLSGMAFKLAKIEKVDEVKQMLKMSMFRKDKNGKKRLDIPFYSFDPKGKLTGFPYRFCIGKDGVEIFAAQGDAKNLKESKVCDRVVFDFLSVALAEPTLKIKGERGSFMTKWLAEFLSYSLVSPWLENSICGPNKEFGLLERRNRNPYQVSPIRSSIRFGTILLGWIVVGSIKKWISDNLNSPDQDDEKAAMEKILAGLAKAQKA